MNTTARGRVPVASEATKSTNVYTISGTVPATNSNRADGARLENAIFSYIQARRSLGSIHINSADIAHALRLSQRAVDEAVKRMGARGVKLL